MSGFKSASTARKAAGSELPPADVGRRCSSGGAGCAFASDAPEGNALETASFEGLSQRPYPHAPFFLGLRNALFLVAPFWALIFLILYLNFQ